MRTSLVAAAIAAQRAESLSVFGSLDPTAWDEEVVPGTTARVIAAHLLVVDAALGSGRIGAVTRIPPEPGGLMGVNPVAVARWEGEEPSVLLALLARSGERLARRVRLLPRPLGRLPVGSGPARGSVTGLAAWHVLDEWVRVGDMPRSTAPEPVGEAPSPVVGPDRGPVLAGVVLGALPRRVLPRVARDDGAVRLVVELDAGLSDDEDVGMAVGPRQTWGIDFSRRHYGPRVTTPPDAVVRVTAPALALVAAGRVGWRGLDSTALRIDGDADLAAAVLDGIAPVSTEQPG